MVRGGKPKTFWLGLITFGYSFLLICQGIWLLTYLPYIYPQIFMIIPGANYGWARTMIDFTDTLVLVTPILGGLILIGVGFWTMIKGEKSRVLWLGLTVLIYSFVLVFQTIWILFGFPQLGSEMYRYITTYVFINFPIFFRILGAVIPPLAGSIIFLAIGVITIKIGLKRKQSLR